MDDKYIVKPEIVRNWKGETKTMWYGYRNGWYQRGTSSSTREETIRLLSEKCDTDKSKIL